MNQSTTKTTTTPTLKIEMNEQEQHQLHLVVTKINTMHLDDARVKDFTLDNAPNSILTRAQAKFKSANASLDIHRADFQKATEKQDRQIARQAFKSQRIELRQKFNQERKLCRQKLNAARAVVENVSKNKEQQQQHQQQQQQHQQQQQPPFEHDCDAIVTCKENLIAVRLAMQLLKQSPGPNDVTDPKSPKSKSKKNQPEQGSLAGLCVKEITLENAPKDLIAKATIAFNNAINKLNPQFQAFQSAQSKHDQKSTRQQLQTKRRELRSQLNDARINARKTFKLVSEPVEKAAAKANLVTARLTQQMFNKERLFAQIPQTDNESPEFNASDTNGESIDDDDAAAAVTPKIPRINLKSASDLQKQDAEQLVEQLVDQSSQAKNTTVRQQLNHHRKQCRQAMNQANKNGESTDEELEAATQALVVAQLATQLLNKRARQEQNDGIQSVTLESASSDLIMAATTQFYQFKQTLAPLQTNIEGATDADAKKAARQSFQEQRKAIMQSLNQQRKSARKEFDSIKINEESTPPSTVESDADNSLTTATPTTLPNETASATSGESTAKDRLLIARLTIEMMKRSFAEVQKANRAKSDLHALINLKELRDISIFNASPTQLGAASVIYSSLKLEMDRLEEHVTNSTTPSTKGSARKEMMRRRKQLVQSLHEQRKAARTAFDEANDVATKTTAKTTLIAVRLAIDMMKAQQQQQQQQQQQRPAKKTKLETQEDNADGRCANIDATEDFVALCDDSDPQQQQQQQEKQEQVDTDNMDQDHDEPVVFVDPSPSDVTTQSASDVTTQSASDVTTQTIRPFADQLQVLTNMGFTDEEGLLIPMLVQNQGSLQVTLAQLLPE